MTENLQLIDERQEGKVLIKSFLRSNDRKRTDERIVTDIKKVLMKIKKKDYEDNS